MCIACRSNNGNAVRVLFILFAALNLYVVICDAFNFNNRRFETKPLDSNSSSKQQLEEVTRVFLDSFWSGKVGGGTQELNKSQRRTLNRQQTAEFKRRYARPAYRTSQMILCTDEKNPDDPIIIGCVGLSVDTIPEIEESLASSPLSIFGLQSIPRIQRSDYSQKDSQRVLLMSNLAILREYRRKGLAKQLVLAAERTCVEWEYDACYLYVEQRNKPAIRLYEKLGYSQVWKDDTAETLLPTKNGDIESSETVLVCMKKKFGRKRWGVFGGSF